MRTIACFGDQTAALSKQLPRSLGREDNWVSQTDTFVNVNVSTALHLLMYSLTGNRNVSRKEELIYETIAALTSNAGHPWVTAHAQFPIFL